MAFVLLGFSQTLIADTASSAFHAVASQRKGSIQLVKPTLKEVDTSISLAASFLERALSKDGRFVYLVDIESGQQRGAYNILRHAGAMYALGMLYRLNHDPRVAETLTRAALFLRTQYVGPGVTTDQQAVWSQPQPDYGFAELGGTGLGLVGLVEARNVRPSSVSVAQLQDLGRFLLFLQDDDGEFVHKYTLETGPVLNWQSLYYPGEAVLGLISLYEVDHLPLWRAAAAKGLSYLAQLREGTKDVPPDHWALIATEKVLAVCPKTDCPLSREAILRHAIQICRTLIREQRINPTNLDEDGSFDELGRTAPAGTSLEGLLAALTFLPQAEKELRGQIEAAVVRGVGFLLRAQIRSGVYAGGMPGAIHSRNLGTTYIRIDYVQHTLAALIRYRDFRRHHP